MSLARCDIDSSLFPSADKPFLRPVQPGGAAELYLSCLRLQHQFSDRYREAATYCGIGETLTMQNRASEAVDFIAGLSPPAARCRTRTGSPASS